MVVPKRKAGNKASLSFIMPLSYGRYWGAMYEKGNEDKRIIILSFILLLFLLFIINLKFF